MTLLFREPRTDCPVELEAHLKLLPPGATCKGMFMRDLLGMVRKHATAEEVALRAKVTPRRYLAFFDYPMTENVPLTVEAAKLLSPGQATAKGLRLLGRACFRSFLSTTPARILMSLAGAGDVGAVFMLTPKSYAMSVNYGRISVERISDRCVHVAMNDYPSFLETYQVGIFEGVFDHFKVEGRVRIALTDLANATIELTW